VRWQVPDLDTVPYAEVQAGRDELDRNVLRLLADLLAPVSES
jgi:hypothetical protein